MYYLVRRAIFGLLIRQYGGEWVNYADNVHYLLSITFLVTEPWAPKKCHFWLYTNTIVLQISAFVIATLKL